MAPVVHQLCICLIWRWPAGDERAADLTGSVLKGRRVVLREKRVSVTPLSLDLTDDRMRDVVAAWSVEGFVRHRS